MGVLTAILACSLHSDERLVRAIVETASQSNPYAVVESAPDEQPDDSTTPRSLEQAVARSAAIVTGGGTPLLGLMQVPLGWGEMYGRRLEELLDPCVNVSIGTAMLSWFDRDCRDHGKQGKAKKTEVSSWDSGTVKRRPCVVRKYGEATGALDLEVLLDLELGQKSSRSPVDTVARASILYTSTVDTSWGANLLFFQPANERRKALPRDW